MVGEELQTERSELSLHFSTAEQLAAEEQAIASQVCDVAMALQHCHSHGVVHRCAPCCFKDSPPHCLSPLPPGFVSDTMRRMQGCKAV